ncbi:DUF5696 domain-containing protein [Paenibacillus sp. GCM10023248]|uniref:DUF5696 domain-containing protein n=1 Tax=unclassified Paenibacillus TaxID=185978 RepID=UPI00237874E1|nr:DUF5696 domain-containing protein [Paenibacillus sp. MAHUQ-63]MDD9269167.1 DUF5696 domain-containing protein [Paenibacillus sp. MAHUQ-63]
MIRMIKMNKTAIIVTILILAAIGIFLTRVKIEFKAPDGRVAQAAQANTASEVKSVPAKLPADADFKEVADSGTLKLKMDEKTGHFIVEDKRNGNVYRSYPDPKDWPQEKISETWKKHLASPLMVQYVDFSKNILQAKETNLAAEGGRVMDVQTIPGGFKLTYELPATGFTIPIQVTVEQDYVETKIIQEGVKETKMGLVWVRLFPFMGAEYTKGQDGYLFIPDGAGALVRFKNNELNVNKMYDELVYGQDIAFPGINNNRNKIMMPVFGMKSGSKGFLAVVHDGDEYADIVAAPAGVLSNYNWVGAQMNYRSSFLQFTTRNTDVPDSWGYVDYNREQWFGSDRTVRYYMLDDKKTDYVGMAEAYRQYLMKEKGAQPVTVKDPNIPMFTNIVGADREKGVVSDRYLNLTTTSQGMQIVDALHAKGIKNMSLTFSGWQKGGYSSFGRTFPVDSHIGGDSGMKAFIDHAHGLGYPVYLEAQYALNNTKSGGFDEKFNAMVNLAGRTLMQSPLFNRERTPVVSDKFVEQMVDNDLPTYKAMGVDGLAVGLLGQRLYNDYNTEYGSSREEARTIQERIMKKVKDTLGGVAGEKSNVYAMPHVNYIRGMVYDNSYDLFSDESVPFAQIAAHGLVTYSSEYVNNRQEDVNDFLRDIEYGAAPSFVFTHAETKTYVNSYGLRYYNTYFPDWEKFAADQYKLYNEALGDVQDQFITGHRKLAEGVKETTYANGKKIIVNYNLTEYRSGDLVVPAHNFVAIRGGGGQ